MIFTIQKFDCLAGKAAAARARDLLGIRLLRFTTTSAQWKVWIAAERSENTFQKLVNVLHKRRRGEPLVSYVF